MAFGVKIAKGKAYKNAAIKRRHIRVRKRITGRRIVNDSPQRHGNDEIFGAATVAVATHAVLTAVRDRDTAARAPSPLRQARLRALLVPAACYGIAAGILNLALVAFAVAHGGTAWAGVLVAIWGIGSLAGGLAYGSRNWRSRVEDRAMACLGLFAATLMLLAAAPGLIMLALLMIPFGVPLSPWLGSLSASVQRAVPAAGSTEAFAWTFTVITAGMSAGSACGGLIIQAASTQAGRTRWLKAFPAVLHWPASRPCASTDRASTATPDSERSPATACCGGRNIGC